MKTALKIAAALAALLLVLALLGVLFVDRIAAQAVERGGSYALGVPTEVSGVDVGLLSGEVSLDGLSVANPDGFESPTFLALDSARLQVAMGSLREPVVEAPQLVLEGVRLAIERREGRTNYKVLLENLERLQGGETPPAEDPDAKRFVIRELVIRDVTANIDMLPAGGELTKVVVQVPELRMQDVGSGGGATMAQLVGQIVQALLEATIEAGGSRIPTELLQDLKGQLAQLEDVALEFGGQVGRELEKVGEQAGEALKGIEKDLGGLLGGKKKQDQQ